MIRANYSAWLRAVLLLGFAVIAGCSKSTDDLIRSARAFMDKGEYVSAVIQLKNALGKEPDHLEGNILLGLAYAETGEAVDAERKLKRALELKAPHDRVMPALGRVLIEREQFKEAVDELRKAKDLSGNALADVSLQLGRAQTELKQYAEARTQFLLAGTIKPADAKLGLARIALAENDRKGAEGMIAEVATNFPDNVEVWIAKGDLQRADGQPDEALKSYQQASSVNPNHVGAHLSQALTLMQLGKLAEARQELDHAKKRSPENVNVRYVRASLALRERKFDECAENLAAVFNIVPRHMPGLLLKGSMHFASNQLQQAELTFSAYLSLQPGHIYARKMLAATLLRKDQASGAIYLLEPLIPHVDNDAELLAIVGEAYMRLGQTRKAKEYFEKSVAIDPKNPANRTKLGVAQVKSGEAQKGIAELESAIALNPDDSRTDHTLVMLLVTQGEYDKALDAVQALEKRRPDKPDTHFLKGAVYRAKQDWKAARASFEQALKLDPKSFPAAAALAQIDMVDKKPAEARARMLSVLKLDPKNLDALMLLANMEFDAGNQKQGIDWLRKAVTENPGSMVPFAVLAEALLKAGDYNEAFIAAQKAREINSKDARVAELLGDIQKAMGKKDAAITSYATAAHLQPNSVALQVKLAENFAENGSLREADNILRRTLAAFPQSIAAKAALAENLARSKNFTEAMDFTKQIQKQVPKQAVGYLLEGEISMAQRDYARASAALEIAEALRPNGLARVRLHQARALAGKDAPDTNLREWVNANPADISTRFYLAEIESKAGRKKAAIEHYQTILKQNSRHVGALNNLALALHAEGDPKAADYAVQAFQMRPTDARLADTAGWLLVSQGKLLEGLPVLTKAVSLDEGNPEIRFHLAQALVKAGDTARARAELKIALASGKNFPQLAEARALMTKIGQ